MNVFTKSEIELMYKAILKVDAITPVFPSPEEATINLSKIWDVTFTESENKKVSGQIAEKELVIGDRDIARANMRGKSSMGYSLITTG